MKNYLQHIEYLGFLIVFRLIRAMPLDMASAVSGKLWRVFAPLNKRHQRALDNLARAFPEKSLQERELIARNMWENLGRVTAESFQLDRLLAQEEQRIHYEIQHLEEGIDRERGSLILSMHTGNWEICCWPMTQAGFNPAGVYQRVKNPKIDALIANVRAPVYPGGLFAKSHDTGRKLVSWVKKGGQLGVLSDQRENKGIVVPFFGHPAPTTPLPAMLAVRLDVPIIIGRVIRQKGVNFHVEGQFLEYETTGSKKEDIETVTIAIQKQFEDWIREYPDQWMWGHRRWES
ncbi:MAG: lysophospholipid acyltransferase family protein [Pseudomonadota bacterium]